MNGEKLISAFKRVRLRFLSRIPESGDSGDVEDALQEAFCRLWTCRDRITVDSQAEGMLVKTAKNVEIDRLRRMQAHPVVGIEDAADIDDFCEMEYEDIYRRIDRLAGEVLSERDKQILYHREKDGWEFDELAEYYGLSESNVRQIVSRSRKALRSIYSKS